MLEILRHSNKEKSEHATVRKSTFRHIAVLPPSSVYQSHRKGLIPNIIFNLVRLMYCLARLMKLHPL